MRLKAYRDSESPLNRERQLSANESAQLCQQQMLIEGLARESALLITSPHLIAVEGRSKLSVTSYHWCNLTISKREDRDIAGIQDSSQNYTALGPGGVAGAEEREIEEVLAERNRLQYLI